MQQICFFFFLWFKMSMKCDYIVFSPKFQFIIIVVRWNSLNLAPSRISPWESRDLFFLSFLKSKYGCTIFAWSVHICFCVCSVYVMSLTGNVWPIFLILFCMVLFTSTVYISGYFQKLCVCVCECVSSCRCLYVFILVLFGVRCGLCMKVIDLRLNWICKCCNGRTMCRFVFLGTSSLSCKVTGK